MVAALGLPNPFGGNRREITLIRVDSGQATGLLGHDFIEDLGMHTRAPGRAKALEP